MDRRHLRAQYRRFLATYTIDSLPRAQYENNQFISCQLEFDGHNLRPVLGATMAPPRTSRLGFKRVSTAALRDNGLVELVALLHLTKSGGFQLSSATLGHA